MRQHFIQLVYNGKTFIIIHLKEIEKALTSNEDLYY